MISNKAEALGVPAGLAPVMRRAPSRRLANKVPISIRLDQDVVEAWKSTGKGWQTRMNAALRQHLLEVQ